MSVMGTVLQMMDESEGESSHSHCRNRDKHPVFHVDRLSPWLGNDVNGNDPPPPPPVLVDTQDEYEVERILDSRKYRNQHQYLVQWRGYNAGHNSWEQATNLTN